MAVAKRITQETFDEVVQGNIEDFDMETEEAVREAITEFEMQGVDLSQIIKDYAGADGRGDHPIVAVVRALADAIETGDAAGQIVPACDALREALTGEGVAPGSLEAAAKAGAAQAALDACMACKGEEVSALFVSALNCAASVLSGDDTRGAFLKAGGCMTFTKEVLPSAAAAGEETVAAAAAVVAASATKNEGIKGAFMKAEVEHCLVDVLRTCSSSASLRGACSAVRALCTGDDPREPASGAFTHSRAFAKVGTASALVSAIKRTPAEEDPTLVAALCQALKQTAANEEICKEVSEEGGIQLILGLIGGGAASTNATLAKMASACLRQLAGSDANKGLIIESGGLPALVHIISVYGSKKAEESKGAHAVQEQAIGALGALMLKNPVGAAECSGAGVFDVVLEAMQLAKESKGVQRQACMFLRNVVVRNPENKPLVLAGGAEDLLRAAKKLHPNECMDVSSAAMRDLGCENYNDGWKPTTAVMGADGSIYTPEELGDEPI